MQISTTAKARALMAAIVGAVSLGSIDASACGSPETAQAPEPRAAIIERALLSPVLHSFSAGSIRTAGMFRNVRLDLAYDVRVDDRWSVSLGFATRIVTPQAPKSPRERGLAGSVALAVRF